MLEQPDGEQDVLYLIQSQARLPSIFECLRDRDYVLLSFKENTPDTSIYFPDSTWTTGRNKLREYAIQLPQKYQYYVFLDDDILFENQHQDVCLDMFEKVLMENCFAILTPDHWGYNTMPSDIKNIPKSLNKQALQNSKFEYQTVDWFDAAFNAFRQDVFLDSRLFPYIDKFDKSSWWISQFLMIMLCNIYYRNEITQCNALKVSNTNHDRGGAYIGGNSDFDIALDFLREKIEHRPIRLSDAIKLYSKQFQENLLHTTSKLEGINKLLSIVRELLQGYDHINFIDVGSANGYILEKLKLYEAYSVAIDPLMETYLAQSPSTPINLYSNRICASIDSTTSEHTDFLVHEELASSSRLEVNKEKTVAEKDHNNDLFYLPKARRTAVEVKETTIVASRTLASVIEEVGLADNIIHFLKVDAQGIDLRVVKSCSEYLSKNVLLLMIETTTDGIVYMKASNFQENDGSLNSQGFQLLAHEKLLQDGADALYYNVRLLNLQYLRL